MSEHYHFGGHDVVELAREYGTPLYVLDEDAVRLRARECRAAFDEKYERAWTHYASKAFLTKDMIRLAESEGLGLDVASGGELFGAMSVGFPAERVVFHGNNKTPREIEIGIDRGVGRFVCDSLWEIECVARAAEAGGKKAGVLLRVAPGVDSHTHRYIATAGLDSKFGVPLADIATAVNTCLASSGIDLAGFHFHVGSQLLENDSHMLAVDIMLGMILDVRELTGYTARELGLGGGFGVRYTEADPRRSAEYFIEPMVRRIEGFCREHEMRRPDLTIEPGRWIVGEAGITLYTVGGVKRIKGVRTYVSVDGGMADNPRPSLYQAEYECVVANKYGASPAELVTVAGRCCESGDILICDAELPPVEAGDIIAVKSTGAYCYSMASNYNKLPFPAVVALSDGQARLSVRRQTYEDLYERDI